MLCKNNYYLCCISIGIFSKYHIQFEFLSGNAPGFAGIAGENSHYEPMSHIAGTTSHSVP